MARQLGADEALTGNASTPEEVQALTNGRGADCVIVAAASKSPIPAQQAIQMCRDRGRVVIVGAVPQDLPRDQMYIKELQLLMSDYVGIVRTNTRLQRAMKRLDLLHEETEQLYQTSTVSPQLCELRNLITVGYLVVKGAWFRKESRGLHYNTDFPGKSPLVQNTIL